MVQVGQWLRQTVQRVKDRLEEQQGEAEAAAMTPEEQLQALLRQVAQHYGDAEQIYPLWAAQQGQMTAALLEALPRVVEGLMAQVAEQQDAVAGLLVQFADLIDEFPLGQVWLNKELAIAAYGKALEVRTRERSDFCVNP